MPFVILDSNYVTIFKNLKSVTFKTLLPNFLMECLINVVFKTLELVDRAHS
jgi:hypothetical protein